jgi:hypothetical protein
MRSVIVRLSILAFLLAGTFPADSQSQISVVWDPSPSPAVAGYSLCWGTNSGVYPFTNCYPNGTFGGTVAALVPGLTYYFAVQAFADDGEVSPFSNEQSLTVALNLTNSAPPPIATSDPATTNSPTEVANSSTGLTNSPPADAGTASGTTNATSGITNTTAGITNAAPTSGKSPGSQSTKKSNNQSNEEVTVQESSAVENAAPVSPQPMVSAPAAPIQSNLAPALLLFAGRTGNRFSFTWSTASHDLRQSRRLEIA